MIAPDYATGDLTPADKLARTLWGEARGEGHAGMAGVASTVLNRVASGVAWWGRDIASVCLAPKQFSCWNPGDPNRPKLLAVTTGDPVFRLACAIAALACDGLLPDTVNGADSYFDLRMPAPPAWARGLFPVKRIGHHGFFVTMHPAMIETASILPPHDQMVLAGNISAHALV